jgi:UPF0176 protein
MMSTNVILFYKYAQIDDVELEKQTQEKLCVRNELVGRILLSTEGINGTLSGSAAGLSQYIAYLCAHPLFSLEECDFKHSSASDCQPFPFLLIKIVSEIVSTGHRVSRPDSTASTRGYLTPAEFHQAMTERDDNTVVLDVRNHNEYLIGHFDDALDPAAVRSFSEYFEFMKKNCVPNLQNKKVLMYCTGGIRCEKASDFLRTQGIQDVHHLQGGIHKYLEEFPSGGHFRGKNFVFDQRVAMASLDPTIIGNCIECECKFDRYHARNVCTVCRDMVLVCPDCVNVLHGELHCDEHQYLKSSYFTFIQYFTSEQLTLQLDTLNSIYTQHAVTKGWKNKRNTLRKQMHKIQLRLDEFESGEGIQAPAVRQTANHCRTCSEVTCDGHCWGFWIRDLKKTEQNTLENDEPLKEPIYNND